MHRFGSVDICNLALGLLQRDPIMSLTEASQEAVVCKRYYNQGLSTLLAIADWGFARRWVTGVTASKATTKLGWTTTVLYPNDCLRLRGVAKTYGGEPMPDYEIGRAEGDATTDPYKVIYTSLTAPVLVYTEDTEDTTLFEPLFVEALQWLLAAKMAIPLGKGRDHMKDMRAGYVEAMKDAAAAELNQGRRFPAIDDDENRDVTWIEAR